MDLGFAISASAQDADETFDLMKEAISSIMKRYEKSKIRYALLTFGTTVKRDVNFTLDLPDHEALGKALASASQPSGEPDLQRTLEEAKMMFKQAPSRLGAKKVLVVIMDKKSISDSSEVEQASKPLEDVNIVVVPVAVGPAASLPELEKTTTNKKFMIIAEKDEDPEALGEEIMRKALKSECLACFHNVLVLSNRKRQGKKMKKTIKSEMSGKSMFSLRLIFGSLHCGCVGSSLVTAASVSPGCRRFESCSGHLSFKPFFSV